MNLTQQAWRASVDPAAPAALVAEGQIRIACVDAGTFRPCRIPTDLFEALSALTASP
jgi:acyl-CoA thioester hydrolase